MSFLQEKIAAQYEDGGRWQDLVATSAPVAEDLVNDGSGASVADVEAFCLDLIKNRRVLVLTTRSGRIDTFCWTRKASKQQGGWGKNGDDEDEGGQRACVLAEREIDWDAEPLTYPERFNKARLPWNHKYLTWCNLDISNVGWDELMTEEGQRDGWWVFHVRDS